MITNQKQKIRQLCATTVIALLPGYALGSAVTAKNEDITMDNMAGLSVKSKEMYFTISGRLQFDGAAWDGSIFNSEFEDDGVTPLETSGGGSEIRRARIYLKGKYKDWQYRFQTDFAGDKAINKSSYIKYSGFEFGEFYAGYHSEPFGLDSLNSSKWISAIERPVISNGLFAGERELGASFASSGKNWGTQIGVFDIGSSDVDLNYAVTGRVTGSVLNTDSQLLHLGLALSNRDLDHKTGFQVKERAGVHSTSAKNIFTGTTDADSAQLADLEIAYAINGFTATTEAFVAKIKAKQGGTDADYSGAYLQLSYFLTGELRSYDVASGTFEGVTPTSENGAWELMTRFESIDFEDNDAGSEADILTIGVNWFPNKLVRWSLNLVSSEVDYPTAETRDGTAINTRFQFVW